MKQKTKGMIVASTVLFFISAVCAYFGSTLEVMEMWFAMVSIYTGIGAFGLAVIAGFSEFGS